MVILAYMVACVIAYNLVDIQVMTVDEYSIDGKWCIDNDNNSSFCTPNNNNYKKGNKILVLYNKDELFQLNILSW
jgi:hypothetical protein